MAQAPPRRSQRIADRLATASPGHVKQARPADPSSRPTKRRCVASSKAEVAGNAPRHSAGPIPAQSKSRRENSEPQAAKSVPSISGRLMETQAATNRRNSRSAPPILHSNGLPEQRRASSGHELIQVNRGAPQEADTAILALQTGEGHSNVQNKGKAKENRISALRAEKFASAPDRNDDPNQQVAHQSIAGHHQVILGDQAAPNKPPSVLLMLTKSLSEKIQTAIKAQRKFKQDAAKVEQRVAYRKKLHEALQAKNASIEVFEERLNRERQLLYSKPVSRETVSNLRSNEEWLGVCQNWQIHIKAMQDDLKQETSEEETTTLALQDEHTYASIDLINLLEDALLEARLIEPDEEVAHEQFEPLENLAILQDGNMQTVSAELEQLNQIATSEQIDAKDRVKSYKKILFDIHKFHEKHLNSYEGNLESWKRKLERGEYDITRSEYDRQFKEFGADCMDVIERTKVGLAAAIEDAREAGLQLEDDGHSQPASYYEECNDYSRVDRNAVASWAEAVHAGLAPEDAAEMVIDSFNTGSSLPSRAWS